MSGISIFDSSAFAIPLLVESNKTNSRLSRVRLPIEPVFFFLKHVLFKDDEDDRMNVILESPLMFLVEDKEQLVVMIEE